MSTLYRPAASTPALSFNGGYPSPVISVQNSIFNPVRIRVVNQLNEANHHSFGIGMRIPIGMDGVPFLSTKGPPIMPSARTF